MSKTETTKGCKVRSTYYTSVAGNKVTCGYPARLCDPDPGEMGNECLRCERVKCATMTNNGNIMPEQYEEPYKVNFGQVLQVSKKSVTRYLEEIQKNLKNR